MNAFAVAVFLQVGSSTVAYIVVGVLVAAVALLVFASRTGGVQMRPCCAVADPRRDLRMRAAFTDEELPS